MRLPRQERLLLQQTAVAAGVFSPPYEFPGQPHPDVGASALRHAANLDRYLESPLHGPTCLLYTSPSPRDGLLSRMPSSA